MPTLQREYDARRMAAKFAPDAAHVETLHRLACDPEYWMSLNRTATIGSPIRVEWGAPGQLPETSIETAVANYREHGFLQVRSALSGVQVAKMHAVIERLRAADWPAVFAFVYDDFWTLGRSPVLRALLSRTLGADYTLLPRIWAHYVYPHSGNAGWAPHLDGRTDSPLTMSVWIPLSSATVANGCMYVVKRTLETERLCRDYHQTDTLSRANLEELLRNARALPAAPGDLLCWDQQILHWGSKWDAGSDARVSLALEFSTPARWPSVDPSLFVNPFEAPPPLTARLALIGRAILRYERFEPFVTRFAALARGLVQPREAGAEAG